MTTRRLFIMSCLSMVVNGELIAQDGSLDPAFSPGDGSFDAGGLEVYGVMFNMAVQADGNIVMVGLETSDVGVERHYVARVHADGTLDDDFNPMMRANDTILCTELQADGKILFAGDFTNCSGTWRNRIARLQADGTLDNAFDPGIGANGMIRTLNVQADGKILIGGDFTYYDDTWRAHIARLNEDGSLDTTFNPGSGVSYNFNTVRVYSTALLPDGRIMIAGIFTAYDGTTRRGTARLLPDGALDTTYVADPFWNDGDPVKFYSIAIQSDGKILAAGEFTSCNGVPRNRIVRLNADGALDTTFYPGTGLVYYFNASIPKVRSITCQSDGKILIGGDILSYNDIDCHGIFRVDAEGSQDPSFNPGQGVYYGDVRTIRILADDKILTCGGNCEFPGSGIRNKITRLNSDGSPDGEFNPQIGTDTWVYATVIQPDGQILICGDFTSYNGASRNGIARLNPDGSTDLSFDPGRGANDAVLAMALQPDGKILIGGWFTDYDNVPRNRVARLNADGTLDTGFDPGTEIGYVNGPSVNAIALQPDNKILLGGLFNGPGNHMIERLNPDGSFDTSFDTGSGPNWGVWAIAVQPNGRILIGGGFLQCDVQSRLGLARLMSDGALDFNFNYPGDMTSDDFSIAMQPDGKILCCTPEHTKRLNDNGSLDTTFAAACGGQALLVQPDGKILVGSSCTNWDGFERYLVARLHTDGSVDTSFDSGPVPGAYDQMRAHDLALQSDGKIILAGWFSSYQDLDRNHIVRLENHFTTAVPDAERSTLTFYPNPTNGRIIVSTSIAGPVTITVTDLAGKLILRIPSQPSKSGSFILDLMEQPAGMYMIRLQGHEKTATARLIKQ